MKQNKIAEKAKLLEGPAAGETSLIEVDLECVSSTKEETETTAQANESAENLSSKKLTESYSSKNLKVSHFPNIDTEQGEQECATTPNSMFHRLNAPLVKFFVITVLLMGCMLVVADRSSKENNYRRLIDRAELDDLSNNFSQAIVSWKAAIVQAISLGDGNKTLADLYFRLAKDEAIVGSSDSSQGNEAATRDLEKAVALYEKVPYTLPEQARTKEFLLDTLPYVTNPNLTAPGYETPLTEQLLNRAITSLNKGEIKTAFADFRNYVSQSNDPFAGSQNVEFSIWRKLENSIPKHSEFAENAVPLMCEVTYAEKFVPKAPYSTDSIAQLVANYRAANLLLDRTIANTGRNPNDYQTTKLLAEKLVRDKEYKAATVCYLRCLEIKHDSAVQNGLAECYRKLHPSSQVAADKRLSVLRDLHDLYAEAFGEESVHVTKTITQCATIHRDIGEFGKAEELFKEALERTRLRNEEEKLLRTNTSLTSWKNPELAYDELFRFYVLTGNSVKARELFMRAEKDNLVDKSLLGDLQKHYVQFCGKSNHLNDTVLQTLFDKRDTQFHRF